MIHKLEIEDALKKLARIATPVVVQMTAVVAVLAACAESEAAFESLFEESHGVQNEL